MTQPAGRSLEQVIQELESHMRLAPVAGVLDRQTVEALDVVGHALTFSGHPRALELWRDALWNRRLAADAREAVTRMLAYLAEAAREGRHEEIAGVCDCLHVVVDGARACEPNDRERDDAR